MTAFRFRLGKVLDLRRQVEKEKAQGVAEARRRSDEADATRDALTEIQEAGRAEVAEAHRMGGSIGHLRNMELVLEAMEDHLRQAEEDCREADQSLGECLESYAEAFKERRTLDQLRSRRLEEWKTEMGRREQKDMDEVAITRHGRLASDSQGA
jgi:flagellar FliJ protein